MSTGIFLRLAIGLPLLWPFVSVYANDMTADIPLPQERVGQDGAPMVLVPGGAFRYGTEQVLSLSQFYIDKYEVTTKLYAKFLLETQHEPPKWWEQAKSPDTDDRPVIGVAWGSAVAYCLYYVKRLPSEQEWEKAALGFDARRYPWGSGMPSDRSANYWNREQEAARSNRFYADRLTPVGRYRIDQSPYGVFDLAGNAREWTASEHEQGRGRVVRGGSWSSGTPALETTFRISVAPSEQNASLSFRCIEDVVPSAPTTIESLEQPKLDRDGLDQIKAADMQARSFATIYTSLCLKHLADLDNLRSKLKDMPKLPAEKASHFLAGHPGDAWPVPDSHGTFVVALPSDNNLCAVHARRANTVTTEQFFAQLAAYAPAPLRSKRVRDEYAETGPNGLTHTLSYEWSGPNATQKMLFTLTTASSDHAQLQVLGTASLVPKRNVQAALTTASLDSALAHYLTQEYLVDGIARHCLAILGRTELPQDYVEAWQQRNRTYVEAADQYMKRRLEDALAEGGSDRREAFQNNLTSTAQAKAQGTLQFSFVFGNKVQNCQPWVSLVDAGGFDITLTSPSFDDIEPIAQWAASQAVAPTPVTHP